MGSHVWLSQHSSCITSKLKPWFFVVNMIVVMKPVEKNRVVQSLSHVWLFVTPGTAAGQAFLSFTISWCLLGFMSVELMMPSNHLSAPSPPALHLSQYQGLFQWVGSFPMSQVFTSGGQSIGASASVLPMNIQGWFLIGLTDLISLLSKRLKSLLQHHGLKASVLWHSAFFMVQLSHPYRTTGKTIALTIWTSVSKVTSPKII